MHQSFLDRQFEGKPSVNELLDFVTIRHLEDIRPCAVNLRNIALVRGFRVALCSNIASKAQMLDADSNPINSDIFGWVDEGQRWWEKPDYALYSPIPRACRYESEVFWCDQKGFHGMRPNPYLQKIDIRQHYSMGCVVYPMEIIVPVHLPFGQISANKFLLIPGKSGNHEDIFEQYGSLLGMLTRRFISGYTAVKPEISRITPDCVLSKRDVQCLHWLSVGKTDQEIGILMSLCRSTVRYHVDRICEKLSAVNRTQAVYKAGQLGYIGPLSNSA